MKKLDIHIHANCENAADIMNYLKPSGVESGILMSMNEGDENGNEAVRKICDERADLYWNCNFDSTSCENIFSRMATYKEQGAVGVGELAINERIDSPIIESIFDAAEKMEMPVLFHMSPEVGYQYGVVDEPGLPLLENALKKHPNLKLVGHSQPFWIEISSDAPVDRDGRSCRGEGKVVAGGRLVELFRNYDNLYGDLSAGSGFSAIVRDEEFGLSFINEFQDRLMFGTDTVSSKPEWEVPLWKWLEKMYELGRISTDVMEKICYKNAVKLYGIENMQEEETVYADTPCGKVKGIKKEGYCLFRGIPYARAERFKYPEEITKWEGELDGTKRGKCCYQIRTFLSESTNSDTFFYREFRKDLHFSYSDDCQDLNIWTCEDDLEENEKSQKPVIVYIHGGAFLGGSGHEKHLDGAFLCKKGVVVVTVNYRLGPFGFLCTSDGIKESGHTGNYGLFDQFTAISWVKHNIRAFGGDPALITVMGQSAGAMCLQNLCNSDMTDGMFERAVMLSGTGYSEDLFGKEADQKENALLGDEVIKKAGCNNLEQFRRLGAWEILSAFMEVLKDKGLGLSSPVIDGKLIKRSVYDSIKGGYMHKIPVIISSTSEDLWQPELRQALVNFSKKCRENGNENVYLVHFKRPLPGDKSGAFHTADMWYWMGSLGNSWRPFTKEDENLSARMQNYLVSFAKLGKPENANEEELVFE